MLLGLFLQAGDDIHGQLGIARRDQQHRFQEQIRGAVQTNPMSSAINEMTKQNMELWRQMQDSYFKTVSATLRGKQGDKGDSNS